jgi:hypothetical protein
MLPSSALFMVDSIPFHTNFSCVQDGKLCHRLRLSGYSHSRSEDLLPGKSIFEFVKCVMSGIAITNAILNITTVNAEFFYSMPSFVYAEHRNLAPYAK